MNSFNDLNGTPATGNSYLQRYILKGRWDFKGFVVSDWGSIGEMIQHGYVKDNYEAAEVALKAGSDMDMESRSYINNLSKLVADKKVPVTLINDAVRRILRKKFEMGLFKDPYRFYQPPKRKNDAQPGPKMWKWQGIWPVKVSCCSKMRSSCCRYQKIPENYRADRAAC